MYFLESKLLKVLQRELLKGKSEARESNLSGFLFFKKTRMNHATKKTAHSMRILLLI